MRRVTIGQRLALGMGLLVLLIFVGVLVTLQSEAQLNAANDELQRIDVERGTIEEFHASVYIQLADSLDYLIRPQEDLLTAYREAQADAQALLDEYAAHADTGTEGDLQSRLHTLNEVIDRQLDLARAGNVPAAIELEESEGHHRLEELNAAVEAEEELLNARLAEAIATAGAARQTAQRVLWGLMILALVGGAVGVWLITRSITQPLNEAVGVLSSSSAELTAQAQSQATGSAEQAAAVSEVTATVEELSRTASQIAESADRVAHSAEENLRSADTARLAVEETSQGMDALKQTVRALAERILALGEKAQQIGVVVNIINDFADDTHLLALNASIEAAGAGEYGKRFAVVAAEVKRLAERVVQATGEIRVLVGEVQSATNAAVMSAEATAREAERGATVAGRSGAAINEILQQVSETADLVKEISLATLQQRQASEQVARTMHDVSSVAQQAAAAGQQSAAAAGQLTDTAHDLSALVGTRQNGRPAFAS